MCVMILLCFPQVNVLFQDVAGRSAGAMTFATYLVEIFVPCTTDGRNKQFWLLVYTFSDFMVDLFLRQFNHIIVWSKNNTIYVYVQECYVQTKNFYKIDPKLFVI